MKTLSAILPVLLSLPVTSVALAQESPSAAPTVTPTVAPTPAPSSTAAASPAPEAQPTAVAPEVSAVPVTASTAAPAPVASDASPATNADPVADTSPEDIAPEHRIHAGFYLSASLGGGARATTIQSAQKMTVDGTGAGVSFHIGGAVAPNLILHGTVSTSITEDPEFSIGSTTVVADNASMIFAGVGPGVTYYVMPANLYVGGSVLMAQTSIEIDEEEVAKTEWGPGVLLRVGKDFWVSERMLLGIGLEAFGATMSDQNTTDEVTAQAFNVVMNLAYD